jgi:hypothetical protein
MKTRASDIAEELISKGHDMLLGVDTLKVMLLSSDESNEPGVKDALAALNRMSIDIEGFIKSSIVVRRNIVISEPKRNWIMEFVGRF